MGYAPGTIVAQEPAAGEEVRHSTQVTLWIATPGCELSLPYPMRDRSSDSEFRVDRLLDLFDDPLLQLGQHIRRAGGFLDLQSQLSLVVERWIERVYGLTAADWPADLRYALVCLMPSLHAQAGMPVGIRSFLHTLLGLHVHSIHVRCREVPVPEQEAGRLGVFGSQLGVTFTLGAGLRSAVELEIVFAEPTSAAIRLKRGATDDARQKLHRIRETAYRLVLPLHFSHVTERWVVEPKMAGIRVGEPLDEGAFLHGEAIQEERHAIA